MDFNKHSELEGKHAFLSASSYHWLNYDKEKLEARFLLASAAAEGTRLHLLCHMAIQRRVKLSKANPTLSMYVNDAIEYNMEVEQPLYYSDNAFGTADTISFRRSTLRIHDLKTGATKASMKQLEVYAALFCLEYGIDPNDITVELRIYQSSAVQVHKPIAEDILHIMDRIMDADMQIEMIKGRDQ